MRLEFYVMAPGDALFHETDFAAFGEGLASALDALQFAPAKLSIRDEDGAELGGFVDAFSSLLPALCLDGAVAVCKGEVLDYSFSDYDETARLVPLDGLVRIEGGSGEPFEVERAVLARALLECGERYVSLMRHMTDRAENRLLTSLEARLAAAREAVAAL